MCIAVYIAANRRLPVIDWDESHPAFYVATLGEDQEAVRNQFTKPHVYYAGSHEGCGCGFQLGRDRGPEDPEQVRGRESLGAFSKYLEDALTCVDDLEVFACWEGDQTARVERRRHLTPTDLRPAIPAQKAAWKLLSEWRKPFVCAFTDNDPVTRGGDAGQPHTTIEGGGHFLQETRAEPFSGVIIEAVQRSSS